MPTLANKIMLHVKEIFIDVKWPNIEQLIWPSGHTERRLAKINVKRANFGRQMTESPPNFVFL